MSDSKVEAGLRVARPVLAPFRGPVRGTAPVGLRPPATPNGRVTLPPFGAIRRDPVPPAPVAVAVAVAVQEEVVEEEEGVDEDVVAEDVVDEPVDSWYDEPVADAAAEPAPQAMTEPPQEAFHAAARDLPLYVPDNVDVSRLTPSSNLAIPANAPTQSQWQAFVASEPTISAPTPARSRTPVLPMEAIMAMDAAPDAADATETIDTAADTPPATPHRMTPMRVTPVLPYRPTPVAGTRTPVRPQTPVDSAAIEMVPSSSNRAVAAALEAVAAQVRRGELVVESTIPAGDDTHSLAAALAAALGALLGIGR
jgi:hypothetical protein